MKKPPAGVNPQGSQGGPGKVGPRPTDDANLESQPTHSGEGGVSALGDTMTPMPGPVPAEVVISGRFPVLQWDRYEFIKLLGKGGMGAVYKARDPRLNRTIALKFIHSGDEQMILRFTQEARAQARIDHPGICKVYEVGEIEGKAYIAMQFINGPSLQQAAGQLSMTEKSEIIRDAAWALHSAHELGIIHRDIKPANITIERETKRTVPRRGEVLANHGLRCGTIGGLIR